MSQNAAAFDYRLADESTLAPDPGRLALAVSIFADRPHLRAELAEDASAAGFRVARAGSIGDMIEGEASPLGDVLLLDVPAPDAAQLAALTRLDMRAAHAEAHVVASTTLEGLDAVFACLDQCSPQILVAPTRAERMIALGRVLGSSSRQRVRELSGEDRMALLRLTEQVAQIAEKLDGLNSGPARPGAAEDEDAGDRVGSPVLAFAGPRGAAVSRPVRSSRPPLPDPRLVRQMIRNRQQRARFFDRELFADPAWDMLLDLTAARAEHTRVSVTSLCIASGVPPTTALRWIGHMTEAGLLERIEDETDRRRAFISLSDKASAAMAAYFAEVGPGAARLV